MFSSSLSVRPLTWLKKNIYYCENRWWHEMQAGWERLSTPLNDSSKVQTRCWTLQEKLAAIQCSSEPCLFASIILHRPSSRFIWHTRCQERRIAWELHHFRPRLWGIYRRRWMRHRSRLRNTLSSVDIRPVIRYHTSGDYGNTTNSRVSEYISIKWTQLKDQ